MRRALLISLAAIGLCIPALHAQDLTEYACPRTPTPPVIDGRGDDPVWQSAPAAQLVDVRYLSGDRFHEHPTEVRLLWDDAHLYLLYVATDPDVWSVLESRDDDLWNDEVLEFFADPDGDGANYVEIEVNALNTVLDLLVSAPSKEGGEQFFGWNGTFETAVHVEGTVNDPSDQDEYWSMEMALPWALFATDVLEVQGGQPLPPRAGDEWRMNFYRYQRIRTDGTETRVDYSAWCPVGEVNFHRPDRFGVVTFVETPTAVRPASWARVKASR